MSAVNKSNIASKADKSKKANQAEATVLPNIAELNVMLGDEGQPDLDTSPFVELKKQIEKMSLQEFLKFDFPLMKNCDQIGEFQCEHCNAFCHFWHFLTVFFAVELLVLVFQKFLVYVEKEQVTFSCKNDVIYPDTKCE